MLLLLQAKLVASEGRGSFRRRVSAAEGGEAEADLSDDGAEAAQEAEEAALRRGKKKTSSAHPPSDPEQLRLKQARTVFVGGIPTALVKGDKLARHFAKYGRVESVRFRSIAMAKMSNPQMRRVGFYKGEFNEKVETCNGYVVFADQNSVPLALADNGRDDLAPGFPLRIDTVEPTISHKKSVFVGNLPFAAQEREVREAFVDCGPIEYVRIVRDKTTSLGRGYAYVCFVKREGAKLAAAKTDVEVGGRVLRIERCKKPGSKAEEGASDRPKKKTKSAPPPPSKKKGAPRGPPPPPPAQKPKLPQRQQKKLNKSLNKSK